MTLLERVQQIIDLLPDDIPEPEVCEDDDGSVCLEWLPTLDKAVSISVTQSNRIGVAWLNHNKSWSGVLELEDNKIPNSILDIIRKLMEDNKNG